MSTTTANQGLVLPESTDPDNVPYWLAQAVAGIEPRLVMRFSSATVRDATLTTPVEGMVAWLNDVNVLAVYDGSAWKTIYAAPAAWTTYVPTIGGTGWALGGSGSSRTGAYRIVDGKVCHWNATITFGAGMTAGTGPLSISLPVTNISGSVFGTSSVSDASVPARFGGVCLIQSTTAVAYVGPAAAGGSDRSLVAGTPMVWASGDVVYSAGTYEIA